MEALADRYARWKAPADDGQILLWPPPAELLRDARDNHQRLSSADAVRIQNVPLPEVRRRMRQWLGHDDALPLIATGHQSELHHPGVWAKNALIHAAAASLQGRAFHFAVDTDHPKHLMLKWPGGSAPLCDDDRALRSQWSGLVPPPSGAHLTELDRLFAAASASWEFAPLVPQFLLSMRRVALTASNLPAALADSLHQLDWGLGLRYDAMIVSPLCLSEPYLLFAHHVLARADAFGADYNAALERYRRENKIKAPGRPMPNLNLEPQRCEVPFWLDSLTSGQRSRASVVRQADRWALESSGERFTFDPAADGWAAAARLMAWLRRHGMRLSPRALTLTAVLRLLAADQFVHGIGGAQYDQVLDALIARHLGIEPPRFSVTTATLYFPQAVGQPRVCVPCVVQDAHRLKHGAMGDEKMRFVAKINAQPRHSTQRSTLFYQMHDRLAAALSDSANKQWEEQLRLAGARAKEERVLFDRELFYAVQPKDRLMELIERYRVQMRSI